MAIWSTATLLEKKSMKTVSQVGDYVSPTINQLIVAPVAGDRRDSQSVTAESRHARNANAIQEIDRDTNVVNITKVNKFTRR